MSIGLSGVERRILGEVYSSSEAMTNLTVLCDDFGGRLAGTEENKAAAEFILGRFEEYGFEDPHLEPFRFQGCEVGPSRLEVVEPVRKSIPCLTLPMTASGETEAELIFLDKSTIHKEEELKGNVVAGVTRHPLIRSPGAGVESFIWVHPYPAMGPPTGCVQALGLSEV